MSRPLRLEFEDAIHHVTARGNAREPVYRDEIDRVLWKETLAHAVERFGWLVLAYCQMGNHFHLRSRLHVRRRSHHRRLLEVGMHDA